MKKLYFAYYSVHGRPIMSLDGVRLFRKKKQVKKYINTMWISDLFRNGIKIRGIDITNERFNSLVQYDWIDNRTGIRYRAPHRLIHRVELQELIAAQEASRIRIE